MAKIYLCLVIIFAAVGAHKHHPKFPKGLEDYKKVGCNVEFARQRDSIIEQSKCGQPKEVFEPLTAKAAHEQVTPSSVWVKRCVGLCEFDNAGTCVATETEVRHIPVRIYNAKTNKETCATFPIEVHLSCGCCAQTADGCASPKLFNPRKCSCQCPNLEERRSCFRKRSLNMKWNRSKCICEERRKSQLVNK